MVLVGLIIPILLKNKKKGYSRINQEEHGHDIDMVSLNVSGYKKKKVKLNFIGFSGTSKSSYSRRTYTLHNHFPVRRRAYST